MRTRDKLICILTILGALLMIGWVGSEEYHAAGKTLQEVQQDAHEIAEAMRSKGYPEDNGVILAASEMWWQAEAEKETAPEPSEPERYYTEAQMGEYPYACIVWQYLRGDLGLSPQVAAGILGNMMCECGGLTLDLQPYTGGYGYYGICMWYLAYTNGALSLGSDITEQLAYLGNTLEWSFDYWGEDYETFLASSNAWDAAYTFERVYERGSWHSLRGQCAQQAYEYFTEGT